MVVRNEPRWGYNSKKRGRPSYLPLVCFEGNTQDCWEGSYHPGDTHVSTITIPLLERAVAKLPEPVREGWVRADGAFLDHEIVEIIEEKRAFYVIIARITRPRDRHTEPPTGPSPAVRRSPGTPGTGATRSRFGRAPTLYYCRHRSNSSSP